MHKQGSTPSRIKNNNNNYTYAKTLNIQQEVNFKNHSSCRNLMGFNISPNGLISVKSETFLKIQWEVVSIDMFACKTAHSFLKPNDRIENIYFRSGG